MGRPECQCPEGDPRPQRLPPHALRRAGGQGHRARGPRGGARGRGVAPHMFTGGEQLPPGTVPGLVFFFSRNSQEQMSIFINPKEEIKSG